MRIEIYKIVRGVLGNAFLSQIIPGLGLAFGVVAVATLASTFLQYSLSSTQNPISPILLAIVLGIAVRNSINLGKSFNPGIKFGMNSLLQFGIILMGIRLSIFSVLKIGVVAVGMVFVCIVAALGITMFLSKRIGISERLGILIAAGTSICGVSAIVATAPVIYADEEEISYAVATITIFGILATLIYPYLTEMVLGLSTAGAGFFIGTSVHDTSQVTATALIYDQIWSGITPSGLTGVDIAITTKLVRNTFMAVVIPLLGLLYHKRTEMGSKTRIKYTKYIPLFVIGYLAMGGIHSLGDIIFGTDDKSWLFVLRAVNSSATFVISVAVACVGLNTDFGKFKIHGYKPFVVGFSAALSVGLVSWLLIQLFNQHLIF